MQKFIYVCSAMSLIIIGWFLAHFTDAQWVEDFDHSTISLILMVPYIFAFAGALAFIFNLDIKAIVGYLSAGLITAIAIIEELGSLPPPREYLIGYIIALFVIVMPLGNVLNLLWFLNPRFRVDATTAISASSPRPG